MRLPLLLAPVDSELTIIESFRVAVRGLIFVAVSIHCLEYWKNTTSKNNFEDCVLAGRDSSICTV